MNAEYRFDLPLLTLDSADADSRAILEKARAKVGFVPNMYAGMAHVPGLLDTYLTGYDAFRATAGFTPPEQEVVFLTISRMNGCGYCMGAHSMIADRMSKLPAEVTNAIRADAPIADAKLAALAAFTTTMVATRGLPSRADAESFLAAGYTDRHILGIVLAIAVKTLSNYSNHLFHTPLDDAFAAYAWPGPTEHSAAAE